MLVLVPGGLALNLGAYLVLGSQPAAANLLVVLQIVLTLAFVASLVRSFSQRQILITNMARD